ncbi:xanthine dehydrogenase family protein molybdopterin-binding subunit [Pseudochelatococcus sp. B33]
MAVLRFGQSITRREDYRLTRGEGRYIADLAFQDMLYAVMVRSPHAHARVLSLDVDAAAAHEGVVAVLTGADALADGFDGRAAATKFCRRDGAPAASTPRPLLVADTVRFVGEPVAVVVATSLALARDAAESVLVEYEELPAVSTIAEATADAARPVWDNAPDNVAFYWSHGDQESVDAALAASHHVTEVRSRVSRVAAMPIEPRAAVGIVDAEQQYTLHMSHQSPYAMLAPLADALGIDASKLRLIVHDIGGSFGMKGGFLRDEAIVLWAARRVGRPVRWVSDRSEAFLSDEHGRDAEIHTTLGLDEDGNFTALKVAYRVNIGAYFGARSASHVMNFGGIAGVYRTPLIFGEASGILTNTQPTAPYRGAGRPDATYALERAIDCAARELEIDPFELRRRNLIPSEAMPFQTGFLYKYDCGDFAQNMEKAAEAVDYAGFAARREESLRRGRLRGIGIANPIEVAAGPFGAVSTDYGRIEAEPDGCVTIYSGTMSTGQGIETTFANIVAQGLGIAPEKVRYRQGDTAALKKGKGNGGSAALVLGGSVMTQNVERLIERGRALAADHFGVSPEAVTFSEGVFRLRETNQSLSLAEAAQIAAAIAPGASSGLAGESAFTAPAPTYPNGCHICEVEVDPETGLVEVLNYVSVEDVGTVLNPLLVEGQIHGGVAQGMGQALKEQIVHEAGSAQLLTGSFMDYGMPLATDIPNIRCESVEVPTTMNLLGVKGVGEAGTVGALAATMNAICHALAPVGVRHVDMPATPVRIWDAIRAAAAEDKTLRPAAE